MKAWPAPLRAYGLLTGLAEPFAAGVLRRRVKRGKEDAARLGERLGRSSLTRPDRKLVWIHGSSVGESLSHLPLVDRFTRDRPDVTVLVTSGTRTSAALLARRLPEGVIHQYVPIDAPKAAARFMDRWRPDLAVFVESELWPNLLWAAHRRRTRLVLLGARVSEKSARAWDRAPKTASAMLGLFDLIYAQDAETRHWIEDHGVQVRGRLDLKRAAGPLPCDEGELERLREAIGGRSVVVAASTHPGEETLIAAEVAELDPRPLLIVAPRHPERGMIASLALSARGWAVAQRSRRQPITPDTQVYIADTLGELGLFYRLADVVVMGGSFAEGLGGHNPLEPARLGKPVVSGPHVDSFVDAYTDLVAGKAALMAQDDVELGRALHTLMGEPAIAEALGKRGKAAAAGGVKALDEAWTTLQTLLPGG